MANLPTVVLAIVANDDVTLQCTSCLMQLQQEAVARQVCVLDLHVVTTFLDALNLYDKGQYLVIMDGKCGVPPEFVFGFVTGNHAAVAGVYPLPVIDWDKVAVAVSLAAHTSNPPTESVQHAGNVYNVMPSNGGFARYLPVDMESVHELRVLGLSTEVLKNMAGPHNEFKTPHGQTRYLFAYDSVFDGKYRNPYQTFARLLPSDVRLVADVQEQCMFTGPAQFAGCVGMRGYVR